MVAVWQAGRVQGLPVGAQVTPKVMVVVAEDLHLAHDMAAADQA